ncbi:TPA: hypothetical protein DF272_04875 [Candidatus Falkowbacteria bacterium]|nr:hypothetical protein [Candidatus Falkowbacteria bacterium]
MSLWLLLHPSIVESEKIVPEDKERLRNRRDIRVDGFRILKSEAGDGFHVPLTDFDVNIPLWLQAHCAGLSFRCEFTARYERRLGIYRQLSADGSLMMQAELDVDLRDSDRYVLMISGVIVEKKAKLDTEAMRTMYYAIRGGRIVPFEDWSNPQIEPSKE